VSARITAAICHLKSRRLAITSEAIAVVETQATSHLQTSSLNDIVASSSKRFQYDLKSMMFTARWATIPSRRIVPARIVSLVSSRRLASPNSPSVHIAQGHHGNSFPPRLRPAGHHDSFAPRLEANRRDSTGQSIRYLISFRRRKHQRWE
jgi:hypothetical protein